MKNHAECKDTILNVCQKATRKNLTALDLQRMAADLRKAADYFDKCSKMRASLDAAVADAAKSGD